MQHMASDSANAAAPADELKALKERFQLLEAERKAFYETSQWTIRENNRAIQIAKDDCKRLRQALQRVQKERGSVKATPRDNLTFSRMEEGVLNLRKKLDQVKERNTFKEKRLQNLRDTRVDVNNEMTRPPKQDTPLVGRIRTLENRLDKAMIKYNEAQSIRKTYEQIVTRLREERVGFDNQLQSLETAMKAKAHDYQQLLLMSHEANHNRELAKGELWKLEAAVAKERENLANTLKDRRQEVAELSETQEKLEERDKMRRDIIAEVGGDLSDLQEQDLKRSVVTNTLHSRLNQNRMEDEGSKASLYEAAFRKIRDATGVHDVNEVIQKFLTQEQTHFNLVSMTKQAQARIESITKDRTSLKATADAMKFATTSSGGTRQDVDQWAATLQDNEILVDRNVQKCDRVLRILVNVKAGIEHLCDKLHDVLQDIPAVPVATETLNDALAHCESKLVLMSEEVRRYEERVRVGELEALEDQDLGGSSLSMSSYNCRINAKVSGEGVLEEDEDEDEDEELDATGNGDDEVLDRSMMKKLSHLWSEKATSKGKRRRKRRPLEDEDEADAGPSMIPKAPPRHGSGQEGPGIRVEHRAVRPTIASRRPSSASTAGSRRLGVPSVGSRALA